MERTVPRAGSEEIDLFIRTYYSLLRSSTDVQIRTLEEVHAGMGSALHPQAHDPQMDVSAFIYCGLRLPPEIFKVRRVLLGQSAQVFSAAGLGEVENWEQVSAPARRRRSFFDGVDTLASYVASGSDIDDLIPMLTAFQIEWNKLHAMLSGSQVRTYLKAPQDDDEGLAVLAHGIDIAVDDLLRLRRVWGASFWEMLTAVAAARKNFRVRLLASSFNDYRRATQLWWEPAAEVMPSLRQRPVYFVSSNTHSLINLVSGFALRHEDDLISFIAEQGLDELLSEWRAIEAQNVPSSRENFLYYALKKVAALPQGKAIDRARKDDEQASGIRRVRGDRSFDVQIQLFELNQLKPEWFDPRLRREDLAQLAASNAVVLNIDYPLGMAAYHVLSHLATRVGELLGVYVIGKSATLNGVVGDLMLPSVVHDEHSQNTYLFTNSFNAQGIEDCLVYGSVLDNQKAISVRGTFLQTPRYMDVFYREGYTDIEMEAGPYLSSVYEMHRPKRHPTNEIVDLHRLPFDLGIIHYASDTPLSKGKNLGAGSLSYYGVDPTYASSLAVWRRIFELELARLRR